MSELSWVCPLCNGLGYIKGWDIEGHYATMICPVCGSSGFVRIECGVERESAVTTPFLNINSFIPKKEDKCGVAE